jgi:NADH:ubiquinone oxidoreductase subunit 6 (subunit J)
VKLARPRLLPALIAAGFFVAVAGVALGTQEAGTGTGGIEYPTTADLGEAFFAEFLGVFEITAVLLVAALVGGVYLAMPERTRREAVRKAVDMKPRVEGDDGKEER